MSTSNLLPVDGDIGWAGRCLCEMPERVASYGAYICNRPGCLIGLMASALKKPHLEVCVKWAWGPRTVLSANTYAALFLEGGIDAVATHVGRDHPDEYVREIFIVDEERSRMNSL